MQPPQAAARWGAILKRTGLAIYEDDCLGWAAELAFFQDLACIQHGGRSASNSPGEDDMGMLLIVLVVLFVLGGGGWEYSRWRT